MNRSQATHSFINASPITRGEEVARFDPVVSPIRVLSLVRTPSSFLLQMATPQTIIEFPARFCEWVAMGERRGLFDERILLLILGILMAAILLRALRSLLHF